MDVTGSYPKICLARSHFFLSHLDGLRMKICKYFFPGYVLRSAQDYAFISRVPRLACCRVYCSKRSNDPALKLDVDPGDETLFFLSMISSMIFRCSQLCLIVLIG